MDTLSPKELAVLQAVAQLGADLDGEPATDTELAAERALTIMRASGGSYSFVGGKPWFGIHDECLRLEELGLLSVDQGMASYHMPGTPAETVTHYFLVLTEAGAALAKEIEQG